MAALEFEALVRPRREQEASNLLPPVTGSPLQGGPAVVVLSIHVSTAMEKSAQAGLVAASGGVKHCRLTCAVPSAHVAARLEQGKSNPLPSPAPAHSAGAPAPGSTVRAHSRRVRVPTAS